MMTSTPSNPQQQTDGRTVRDIVEYNQDLVSEPWCRRIIRQILQSLEVQYGMRMPHRPITPDSVLVLDSGDPMLLSGVVAPLDPPPANVEARDLHDLAAVVHYAITLELAPTAPLRGRPLPDYSDSFLAALDRCLFADAAARPQTIDQLRDLLGIVVLGPPSLGALPPELHEMPVPARRSAPDRPTLPPPLPPADPEPEAPALPGRWQRRLMIGGAALVLLAALAALFSLLRQTDASDALTLSLPAAEQPPALAEPSGPLVAVAEPAVAALDGPVIDETAADAPATVPAPAHTLDPAAAAPDAPDSALHPTAVQLAPQGTAPGAAVAGTTYRLAIKPWGTIVVDGVERGVSPPLRHLTLPPGEHTIGIVNPGFPEHTVTVQSTRGATGTIELDFTEEGTP